MSLPKRDGVHDRYYLIHKPEMCIRDSHQSKQYRLEDQLLKYFPEEIEKHKRCV